MTEFPPHERGYTSNGTRWTDTFLSLSTPRTPQFGSRVIGVLEGEGVGPEVIPAALQVLSALESGEDRFEIRFGGRIGLEAEAQGGAPLSAGVVQFCRDVFADGGAILAGPGGGRFVYDLRKELDLFCKLSPLRVCPELTDAGRLRPEHVSGVDVLLVRENVGGIYQGEWEEVDSPHEGRRVTHSFVYTEAQVDRIVAVAAEIARRRRGLLTVVIKDGGMPAMSRLWRDQATRTASRYDIACSFANIDYAAYRLIQDPRELDVLVAPNLFGDILADVGALLLGSRGLSFSGNFSDTGAAVYQTNHGAAYDLAGADQANPAGQIYSLAMLLRESFGLCREAALIEAAVAQVWRDGWRTADLCGAGHRAIGTGEMADRVAAHAAHLAATDRYHEAGAPAD